MKIALYIVGGLLAIFALSFVLNSMGMISNSFFGKWQEEIRHEIQMESTAHIQGMQRNLSALLNDYNAADNTGRIGIIAAVKHQYSQEDTGDYPAYLRDFLSTAGIY